MDYPASRKYGSGYAQEGQRRGPEEPYYENYRSTGSYERRSNLPRTISAANVQLAEQYNSVVQRDYVPDAPDGGSTFFANTPMFTLTLPVIENKAFREYVFDILRDSSVQNILEKERVINWCETLPTLTPLNTIRDGNCLLHAASLGMWGFQDRQHFLRHALNSTLEGKTRNTLYDRWKYAREREDREMKIISDPRILEKEWQIVKRQSSTTLVMGQNLDSLDDFHVFTLANVLRRPILMYAAEKIRSLSGGGTMQRLNFSGVYLPLLWDPSLCKRSPLPLTYCNGHFSALTMMESPDQYKRGQLVLPLVEYDGITLPVKFFLRMEDPNTLLHEYLDVTEMRRSSSFIVQCCKLTIPEATKSNNYTYALARAFVNACEEGFERERKGSSQDAVKRERRCECKNCGRRDGEERFSGFCFDCYQQRRDFDSGRSQDGGRDRRFAATQNFHAARNDDRQSQMMRSRTTVQSGGRGTVKCSECSEPGLPQFLGRCERCHNRMQSSEANSIYEPLPSPPGKHIDSTNKPPSLPLPRDQSERSKCRTPGCDFFGTKEFRFYCSKCFETNMEKILKEADEGPPVNSGTAPRAGFSQDSKVPSSKESFSTADPSKCRECRDFYGSEELNGLCNKCFLKSTEKPGQSSSKPSGQSNLPDPQDWHSRDRERQDQNMFLGRDQSSDSSQIYSKPASKRGSKGDQDSGLIYKLTSQMGSVNLQAECVLCRGEEVDQLDSEAFVLCRKHTLQLVGGGGTGQRGGEEGGRLSASFHPGDGARHNRDTYDRSQSVRGGQYEGGYGSEFSKRPSVRDDLHRFSQGSGGSYDSPEFPSKSSYSSHVQQNNKRHDFDGDRDVYSRSVDYPPSGGGMLGGGYERGAGDTGRGRNVFSDGGGYPEPGGSRWSDAPPMDRRMSNSSRAAEDWNRGGGGGRGGNGTGRNMGGAMGGTGGGAVGGARGGTMGGARGDTMGGAGGGAMGGAGGGAMGGARGGAMGGAGGGAMGGARSGTMAGAGGGAVGGRKGVPENTMDKLCRYPGCSYYCYEDLDRYCPDCYEMLFNKQVNRDIYPLV